MNKIVKKIFMILFVGVLVIFPVMVVTADSGFDYDYDSGGSSWSSSSSFDSSSSSSSSSEGSCLGENCIIDAFLFIFGSFGLFGLAIAISIFEDKYRAKHKVISLDIPEYEFGEMSDGEIKEIDSTLNKEKILDKTFDLYYQLQNAWMEFDEASIRKLVSDELYNSYNMQLNDLREKNQKNIMEDITKTYGFVVAIRKEAKVESIDVVLNITMKDYIVDKNGALVRGNKIPHGIAYLITIDRAIDSDSFITKCPNCGNKISDVASQKCSSCGADLVTYSKEFVITKKQNIGQGSVTYRFMPSSGSTKKEVNINEYDSSIDNSMFKTKVDNIFIQLYTGLSNGDLKDVDHKISDSVYKIYQDKVDKDKNDNLKHEFRELNVTSTEILSVDDSSDNIIVKVRLVSKYMDYYVDKDTNEYVKGNNKSRDVHYNTLTFIKKKNSKDIKSSLCCPGCGKPANVNKTGHCAYCGATFNTEDYDYVLSDIHVE